MGNSTSQETAPEAATDVSGVADIDRPSYTDDTIQPNVTGSISSKKHPVPTASSTNDSSLASPVGARKPSMAGLESPARRSSLSAPPHSLAARQAGTVLGGSRIFCNEGITVPAEPAPEPTLQPAPEPVPSSRRMRASLPPPASSAAWQAQKAVSADSLLQPRGVTSRRGSLPPPVPPRWYHGSASDAAAGSCQQDKLDEEACAYNLVHSNELCRADPDNSPCSHHVPCVP